MIFYAGEGIATAPPHGERSRAKRARADEVRIIDVTSHAHIFGHHRGAYYFEQIIEQAVAAPDIWVGTRAQIADHVLSHQQ